jgi:pSer/pThr/pTyr-binding forkhead associated (FHA) protein
MLRYYFEVSGRNTDPAIKVRFFLDGDRRLVIGRGSRFPGASPPAEGVDIPLSGLTVSRRHCAVWSEGESVWAEDLDSRWGFLIDGERRSGVCQVHLDSVLGFGAGQNLRLGATLPIDDAWLHFSEGVVRVLAQSIRDGDGSAAIILADALEDAGCTARPILDHLRLPAPHANGCWVVDLLLSKDH